MITITILLKCFRHLGFTYVKEVSVLPHTYAFPPSFSFLPPPPPRLASFFLLRPLTDPFDGSPNVYNYSGLYLCIFKNKIYINAIAPERKPEIVFCVFSKTTLYRVL